MTGVALPPDLSSLTLAAGSKVDLRYLAYYPEHLSHAVLRSVAETSGPYALSVNAASAGGFTIAADFVGISMEASAVQQTPALGSNAGLKAILAPLGTAISVRFGGDTSDSTTFSPSDSRTVDASNFVASLGVGSSMLWGLNNVADSPSTSAQQALDVTGVLGTSRSCFQVGNEPDDYPGGSFSAYVSNWSSIRSAVISAVPGACFAGPDTGERPGTYEASMVSGYASQISMLTKHIYPYALIKSATPQRSWITSEWSDYMVDDYGRSLAALAGGAGLKVRMSETGLSSALGIGTTPGYALWAVWEMIPRAREGGAGVNWHWGDGLTAIGYSPAFRNATTGLYSANPLFYAMVMFHQLAGSTILASTSGGPASLPTLAVMGADGKVRVLIVNKHATRQAITSLSVSGYTWATASVLLLTGPSYLSTSVTLGGAQITSAGTWAPTPISVSKGASGSAQVVIPAASAAVVTLS